jgi:c(7)-type cytochrome triheme protein
MILPLLLLVSLPVLLFARDFKIVAIPTEKAGTVYFNHDVHLQSLGNNCTICHNSIFALVRKGPPVTMAEMEKGKSCGICHNKIKAFGLAECVKCHVVKEIPIEIPNFGTVTFSHKFHLGMFGCGDCHNQFFRPGPDNPHVSMAQMEKGASCGGCHDGKSAFSVKESCTKCHVVKEIKYTAAASFSHKFHLELFKCSDCHSKIFVAGPNAKRYTMLDMERGKSCGSCHDGSTAFSVKTDCGKCHQGVSDVVFKAEGAFFPHNAHLKIYQCADCHSKFFVGGVNSKRYTMADMDRGRSCGTCHDAVTAFSVDGSCDRCHRGTKEIPFTMKNAGKLTFSHTFHLGMYKCDDCHNQIFVTGSKAKRYTMENMEKGASCGACHDGKTAFTAASNCSKCHPVKNMTFAADAFFGHNRHLEMYKCADCHNKVFNAGPDNKRYNMVEMERGRSCGACHDGVTGFSVQGDCDRCHKSTLEITLKVPETGPTPFSHKVHVGMYKCGDCHNGIFTTGVASKRFRMADMEAGQSCGTCHDGKTAFSVKQNCERCHPIKEIQFKPTGALFSHKFHIGIYRCNDCHDRLFIPGAGNKRYSMPDMEKGKSCGACHDGKSAFTVEANCGKCHVAVKAIKYEVPGKTGNVLFSHKLHVGFGYSCIDCHYKIIPTGVNRKLFTMKNMGEGKSCGACHGFAMAFSVKDANSCGRCHNAQESDLFNWTPPEE